MKDGLDEVVVHDLGAPLDQPLLDVEDGQVTDVLLRVDQGLQDPEEQGPRQLQVIFLQ